MLWPLRGAAEPGDWIWSAAHPSPFVVGGYEKIRAAHNFTNFCNQKTLVFKPGLVVDLMQKIAFEQDHTLPVSLHPAGICPYPATAVSVAGPKRSDGQRQKGSSVSRSKSNSDSSITPIHFIVVNHGGTLLRDQPFAAAGGVVQH